MWNLETVLICIFAIFHFPTEPPVIYRCLSNDPYHLFHFIPRKTEDGLQASVKNPSKNRELAAFYEVSQFFVEMHLSEIEQFHISERSFFQA